MSVLRALALGLAAGLGPAGVASAAALAGSEWRPVEIAGAPVDGAVEAFLQFRVEDRASGSSGCNRFTGSFAADPDAGSLAFGPLATTRMLCPEPQMAFEARFLDALTRVRGYRRDGVDLVLSDAAGNVVMRMAQTDAD